MGRLLDLYSKERDPSFDVEFRPCRKKTDGEFFALSKSRPEDSWTTIKRISQTDVTTSMAIFSRKNITKSSPDIYKAETVASIYVGIDAGKKRPVVTDRNPHSEGLMDIHTCLYLPSAHEKNQNLPDYLTQDVTMMELPESIVHTAGIVPGLFMLTPKLTACNIFVAYDLGLHKFFVMRVGGRNPHKPPDMENQGRPAKRPQRVDEDLDQDTSGGISETTSGQVVGDTSMVPMNRFEAEELRLMSIRNRVSVKLGNQTTTLMKSHHKHRYGPRMKKITPHSIHCHDEESLPEVKTTWGKRFREYRSHADTVTELLRKQGYNAKLVLRVATDRDWHMDVRDQQFWIQDLNQRGGDCIHYMYRGEAVFYGVLLEGVWRFGLKDFSFANTAWGKANKLNQFPLKLSPDTEAHLEKFMSKENGAIGPQFRGNKLSDKDVFTSEAEVEIEMQEDLTKDLDSITSTEDKNNQDIIGETVVEDPIGSEDLHGDDEELSSMVEECDRSVENGTENENGQNLQT